MALVKGVNSYVTVAEADTYFADRIDVLEWTSADEATKSQALITATQLLDDHSWVGTVLDVDQDLAFPRSGSYFDPKLGMFTELTTAVPARIIRATYELAYHLIANDGLLDSSSSVADIKVGPIELTNIQQTNTVPSVVRNAIKPLKANSGGNWWRAN